jgi:zinc/manganese transport system permease protein
MIASIFEMFDLPFMVHAFVAALITGIALAYLGVHVVNRGIVFVDLALGQISSLGVAFAAYIGFGSTSIPILFTLTGALLMSFINIRDKRLKQEAIIGIFYAFSSAITVLLISKTPHGDSDIQEVLFGNILAVDFEQIKNLVVVFGAIALMHIIFFGRFFRLTHVIAESSHGSVFNTWNFLFYLSIGLAIVFAVRVNGVIPVFSFLIIPAVSSMLLSKKGMVVIILSLVLIVIAAFFGLYASFKYDFPAGASIVSALGGVFVIAAFYNILFTRIIKKKLDNSSQKK